MESYEELVSRHEKEASELADSIKAMLKAAKKSQRAELEAKAIQMNFDLKARHREEEEEWESNNGAPGEISKPAPPTVDSAAKEDEAAKAKKEKAKKKHDKRELKEKMREEMKKEIQESNAGQSLRENENSRIDRVLRQEGLSVKPIISDGHCLYRALSDQLQYYPEPPTSPHLSFQELRRKAAEYIRAHSHEFAPFLSLEPNSAEMDAYCDNIINEHKAEWGGQVEIQALCAALNRKIHVYSADSPVLHMGEEQVTSRAPPLRVSYHKHYYALGEHYNSVVYISEP